jgi:hypothetical protein
MYVDLANCLPHTLFVIAWGIMAPQAPFTVQSLIYAEGADNKTANRSPANRRYAMAAFLSSTWQGTSTRIPDTNVKLTEGMTAQVVQQVLSLASPQSRVEAKAFMRGELTELSPRASAELGGLVQGYVRQSGAGR